MPYIFHAPAPTRYPSADTLFPPSAETLTWHPAPTVEDAPPRDKHVQRARNRIMAFLQARMSAKLAHVIAYAGGSSRSSAVAAAAELVKEGALRTERRQQADIADNRRGIVRTPNAGTPWLVLVRP